MDHSAVAVVIFSLCLSCGDAPTLSMVQKKVFTPSCGFGTCHNPPQGAGGLVLNADSYAKIVNVPSSQVPGGTRVVPGDADNSFLFQKLSMTTEQLRSLGPDAGESMPPGEPLEPERLQLVRDWINLGAKND